MDFDFSDDQEQLRDAVRKYVDKGYPFERRQATEKAGGFDRAAYTELAELGLTVSDVVRMTLTRVAKDHALPFELKVPNAETRAAIEASRATMKARRARFTDAQEMFDALDQEARQQ